MCVCVCVCVCVCEIRELGTCCIRRAVKCEREQVALFSAIKRYVPYSLLCAHVCVCLRGVCVCFSTLCVSPMCMCVLSLLIVSGWLHSSCLICVSLYKCRCFILCVCVCVCVSACACTLFSEQGSGWFGNN